MRPSSGSYIFASGFMPMATLMNSLSRNGTRTSSPHAEVALLARRQSYWCSAFTLRQVSLWNSSLLGAKWK
uniref:AsnS3 n=1 Tax=Arundo donax TaxID=35708 RepID=A0A0A9E890_ARUDO